MKNEITESSILLFEKKGFSTTSIQDIVDELNVTKGTFYYYFSSKEQLLMDIHDDYITNLLERQKLIIQNDSITQKQKIIRIIELLIHDIEDQGPSARVYTREIRHLSQENIEIISRKREKFRLNVEKVIQQGVSQNEFKENLKIDMITFGILGITNWSYNWFNPNGAVSAKNLARIYSDMILTGIQQ